MDIIKMIKDFLGFFFFFICLVIYTNFFLRFTGILLFFLVLGYIVYFTLKDLDEEAK